MKIVRLDPNALAVLTGKRLARGTEAPPLDPDDETFVGVLDQEPSACTEPRITVKHLRSVP